jgi:hypothetical protein
MWKGFHYALYLDSEVTEQTAMHDNFLSKHNYKPQMFKPLQTSLTDASDRLWETLTTERG